ncbi:MAG: bifunctional phosphoribosyl-AMP cyclohydrolase/phosphoribosyl-ATP diphosphatase HisIE [Vampirovibrionales bacterium]|nr:bifunctional phosphoribosyl-AMP cyclohydrolase/phosphoribosyl-ATP diphosphatase HisIE [Vampirovibrionales bacterium]
MIIPSIDLMNGEAVQLKQGKEKVLTASESPAALLSKFNRYGQVAVIDLDAAITKKNEPPKDNIALIKQLCSQAEIRVGGGIRTVERGKAYLRAGAAKIIIGTSAEPEFLMHFPPERVIVALDHLKTGEIVDSGWTRETGDTLNDRAERLAPYCSGFLLTFVDDEGTMSGMATDAVKTLKQTMPRPITVAGGINTTQNAVDVLKTGVDAQVGMALYTGQLDLNDVVVNTANFTKGENGLLPTIVQDAVTRQILMLAYSSPESLRLALTQGKGIYYSRSRNEIWEKGLTSGNTQQLISCRLDCDNDALLFQVIQTGATCHTGQATCFADASFNIDKLYATLAHRKANLPPSSFSAQLFSNRKKLLRKILEEAFEVATAENRDELVWEVADLFYMMSVLAVDEGIAWHDIVNELGGRHR